MTAGARTYGIQETLIEPRVLPPPPTRHALLAFLIALAAILHLGTVGWSDIHNGPEGEYASAARDMLRANSWSVPAADWVSRPNEAPLLEWLLVASFKIFGVNAVAARVPVALATVICIAFTFLIGESLAGYWRGFVAGLIHLCSLGLFTWGRLITPGPVVAACLGATIFCAVRGFQRQRRRPLWFAAAWLCVLLAVLAKGVLGLIYPAAIFVLLALFVREARIRFRQFLRLEFLPIVLLIIAALVWIVPPSWQAPFGFVDRPGIPLLRFVGEHLIWWFPALLLALPALIFAPRKVFRLSEFDFAEALPLVWIAVGVVPLLLNPARQDWQSLSMWSGFALLAAMAWDRSPPRLRLAGIAATAVVGTLAMGAAAANVTAPLPVLPSASLGIRSVLMLAGLAIVVCCALAVYFSWKNRETLAIAIVLLGMVPIGLSIAEGMARFGPYFSLANAARFLQPQLGDSGEVIFEGHPAAASSLRFYLDQPPIIAAASGSEASIMQEMSDTHPVFLIVDRDRVPYWQEQLTARFHLYHQETTCGSRVVLSNQP
jgi:4-amino-4-deoxy-L-arabinose transferase-like glycosyltransferase